MPDVLERLRADRADVPPPSAATIASARADLLTAIHAEHRVAPPRPRRRVAWRRRPSTWRRRLVPLAAVACVSIVIGLLAGTPGTAPPSAALGASLERLAHQAERQKWSGIPGPGEYLYTESKGLNESRAAKHGHECKVQYVEQRRSWIATDGSGALDETARDARFTSVSDREQCSLAGVTDAGSLVAPSSRRSFPAGGLSFPAYHWHTLSTDPATLLAQLRKLDGGPETPAEDFVHIGDFLRESDTPPVIRAALFKAAELIPGVRLLGDRSDPTGRSGTAVASPAGHGVGAHLLIFNRRTAALLAEESLGEHGRPVEWTAYKPSRIVDAHPGFPEVGHAG